MKYEISIPADRGTKYEMFKYPAGELQVRIMPEEISKVRESEKLEVTARIQEGEVMELALLTDALFETGAFNHTLLRLPYLPYGRADRRFVPGDCFGLKVFSQIVASLGYDEIRTVDMHSRVGHKFLDILDEGVYKQVWAVIEKLGGGKNNVTILLPDKGASRYKQLLSACPKVLEAEKIRDPQTGKLSGFKVPPLFGKVLIVDDICDGGGTFIGIADEIRATNPPVRLFLYVTHGIFSKGKEELLKRFEEIFTTETFKGDPR